MTSTEGVSGNTVDLRDWQEQIDAFADDKDADLHPDLVDWVEQEGPMGGPMLRHPLIYDMFLMLPGQTNRAYLRKRELLAEAEAAQQWHTCVFLHERPYRFKALIDYVTGRNADTDEILPLTSHTPQETLDLVADVWVDSENIEQNIEDWRALMNNGEGFWLGTPEEREQFEALPRIEHKDGPYIHAWRGGAVGDWSWTTDERVAQFFSRRSGYPVRGYPVRGHQFPVSDVFGYLTRRSEAELLVRFTEFRSTLVYPVSGNEED